MLQLMCESAAIHYVAEKLEKTCNKAASLTAWIKLESKL